MERIVKKFIKHSINGDDVLNICDKEANLLRTSELKNYSSIDQVLGKYRACILLYDMKKEVGHWSCIFEKYPGVLEFYCPYALHVDEANEWTDGKPYLSNLLNNSRYQVYNNDYQLQKYKNDINVCGRYVGARLMMRHLPLQKFTDLFIKNKCYDSDFWVTILTLFCEN